MVHLLSTHFFIAQAELNSNLTSEIIALLVTLSVCAFSSASETALTSVNRIRIRNLAEEGDKRAKQIDTLLTRPNVFLTAILVLNNVAIILASSLGTIIALSLFSNYGEIISTIFISIVALVFCEVTPKNAALQNAETWSRLVIPIISAVAWLLQPISWMLTGISSALLGIFGIPLRRTGPSVTEGELLLLVNVGEEEGVLEKEERSMISSIFELSDTTVREIMVPRIDMVTLEAGATLAEAVDLITQGGQSRIPMYEGTIDNIIGVLYAKDLLREMRQQNADFNVRHLIRGAYFVPEAKKLDDLLHELQTQHVHMAIVFDEYGAVAGLVTIEDLVEEIIGDIQDEYDREEVTSEKVSATEYIVDAKMNLDDFNDLVGSSLESDEDYDSVAGFVLAKLDKIPNVGDTIVADGIVLTVMATRGRRITKIRAQMKTEQSNSSTGRVSNQHNESESESGTEHMNYSILQQR